MKSRFFLVKPASSLCNMRCRYCFYEDESENRMMKSMGLMPLESADRLIEQAFSGLRRNDSVTFLFQGGEPTLAGLDYFRHFVQQAKKANPSNAEINYSLQTNGLCVDDEWARFFKENNFLVGISIDGAKIFHDKNRLDASNGGTWKKALKAASLLSRHGVELNFLCVVTKHCAKSPEKAYTTLKNIGASHLQFIACLDPIEQPRGKSDWSLLPDDYGKFLCGLFDLWHRDWKRRQYTSIRLFEDFVRLEMGLPASACATNGKCGSYFVVEGDGSVYPCDFYALDKWRIGNINSSTLDELSNSEVAVRFIEESLRRPPECNDCKWLRLCNGGCKRDWHEENGMLRNYYCDSFKTLFEHSYERIAELAQSGAWGRF